MRINKIIIIIFLVSLLLLAGCGKKECDTKEDCTSKGACFIGSCVKGKCEYKLRPGCTCGDGNCTKDENECTCPEDCGQCTGAVGQYVKRSCVNNLCVTSVNSEKKSVDTIIQQIEDRVNKVDLYLKASYDEPFDIKRSLFNVNIKIKRLYADTADLKIKKVRLIEHTAGIDRYGNRPGDQPVTLAEREYSKILFDENSEFNKSFPVIIKTLIEDTDSQKSVTLEITFEYKSKDRYGVLQTSTGTYEKEISILFINPSGEAVCTLAGCNDQNQCTRDYCDPITNFCEHEIISKGICCGDDICSPGEDRCQCAKDCGTCTGDMGAYMSMGCSAANVCSFAIKNPALIQSTSKLTDVSLGGASMSLKVVYDSPFSKKDSMFSFTFEPKSFTNTRNVVLKKLTILSEGTILGETSLNTPLSETSPITVSTQLSYTTLEAEEAKSISARFDYSYESQDTRTLEWNNLVGTYTYTVGQLTILNPA